MDGGYTGPTVGEEGMDRLDMSMYEHHRMTARQLLGQWVHCHSIYGTHQGILYKAMRKGIVIINQTQLASADGQHHPMNVGTYQQNEGLDLEHVQFFGPGFFPGPGMFLPYPALYGIVPRPAFFI